MFANNALLGGGVRVRVWIRENQKKIRGTTKPLMANLDITCLSKPRGCASKGTSQKSSKMQDTF